MTFSIVGIHVSDNIQHEQYGPNLVGVGGRLDEKYYVANALLRGKELLNNEVLISKS